MTRNRLRNPGFELGDQDWAKSAGPWTIEKDAANSRNGSWIANIAGGAAGNLQSQSFNVRPGFLVSVSGWWKHTSDFDAGTDVKIRWLDKDGSLIVEANGPNVPAGTTSYTESAIDSATAPSRAKKCRFKADAFTSTTGQAWFDDASLTGDLIEDIPSSAGIAQQRLIPQEVLGSFQPLVGSRVFDSFNAGKSDRWTGAWTFTKEKAKNGDLNPLSAFFKRLGKQGLFFAYDATRRVPKNGVVNGLVVDGGSQTGNELSVRGGTANTTPLVEGDYVEVREQYFQLQTDLEIGPEGTGTMQVWPAIRTSPADGEDVITDHPKMVARVSRIPEEETHVRRDTLTEINVAWEEFL